MLAQIGDSAKRNKINKSVVSIFDGVVQLFNIHENCFKRCAILRSSLTRISLSARAEIGPTEFMSLLSMQQSTSAEFRC